MWDRLLNILLDWVSSNSPFAKGMSLAFRSTDLELMLHCAARILSPYFHLARMMLGSHYAYFYLCLMRGRTRFTSKCQTRRARHYIKFRRNFKTYLALRFHYSMDGGYSTVGFHCHLFTIHRTNGVAR